MKRELFSFYMSLVLLVSLHWITCHAEQVIVSVQSQSQKDMDALTAQVDAQAQGSGPTRVTLGAIEATMSRVVDVDSPYLVTVPQSMPTLTLLGDVNYNAEAQTWTLTYETVRVDPSAQINDYSRVLYFTKHNLVTGDTRNPCLVANVDDTTCLGSVMTDYVTLGEQSISPGVDSLEHDGTTSATCADTCRIKSTKVDQPLSAKQTLTIVIPHDVVRNVLATRSTHVSPLYGERVKFSFGVGMIFVSPGSNNMIVFDAFDIIENSHDQVAISKVNNYAVARHISFWTEVASNDLNLRIATIEYLLDAGQSLIQISAAINGRAINSSDCTLMQARIDSLSDPKCITQHPLCQPVVYTQGSGATLQTWATYVLPLPSWHIDSITRINTLLTTNDTTTNTKILSTLNFETSAPPQPACENAVPVAFNPMQYVVAELFRGHELHVEQIAGSFSVQNETSFSMAESLMTVVLRPADTESAYQYFQTYTDEKIELDEVYISHAIEASILPDHLHNEAIGVSNGRSHIQLDPTLSSTCPAESMEVYTNPTTECVTTQDWGLDGELERTISSPQTLTCSDCHYFVREVGLDVMGDHNWLRTNIFGASDPGVVEAFYSQVTQLVPVAPRNLAAHAKTYWVWPVYHWPNKAPVGLQDKTIVSLSWSITKAEPNSRRLLGTRKLLALPAHSRLTGKAKLDPRMEGGGSNGYHVQVKGKTSRGELKPISVSKVMKSVNVPNIKRNSYKQMPANDAMVMHENKGFNPYRIQNIPERSKKIKSPHRTVRKLLSVMQHIGVAAFNTKMSSKLSKPSIHTRKEIKEAKLSTPMLPKLPTVPMVSLGTSYARQVQHIEKRLSKGINKGNARQSPVAAIPAAHPLGNTKDDAKRHLQNKRDGVVGWKNVW